MAVRRRMHRDRALRHRGRVGLALGLVAVALFLAARRHPELTESLYSRALYPRLAGGLARAAGLAPFSLTEWVFLWLIVALVWAWPGAALAARRAQATWPRSLLAGGLAAAGRLGATWFVFLLVWGLNYARPAPESLFGLDLSAAHAERPLLQDIGRRLDQLRARTPETVAGVVATPDNLQDLDEHLVRRQAEALEAAGLPAVAHGRVKTFLASRLLLPWALSGMYGPFTGEPNVVLPAAPAALPFTMAHERAHLSGLATEDAASFVALLTCWRSERPAVRYSAWLTLYVSLGGGAAGRAPGVVRDLRAREAFVRQHHGAAARLGARLYSGYLRAHGVREGVANYGRAARLARAWLIQRGLPPEPEAATGD